jgi:hypothetical protein
VDVAAAAGDRLDTAYGLAELGLAPNPAKKAVDFMST